MSNDATIYGSSTVGLTKEAKQASVHVARHGPKVKEGADDGDERRDEKSHEVVWVVEVLVLGDDEQVRVVIAGTQRQMDQQPVRGCVSSMALVVGRAERRTWTGRG